MSVNSEITLTKLLCLVVFIVACSASIPVFEKPVVIENSTLPLKIRWEYSSRAETIGALRGIPAFVEGEVYFSSGPYIYALDALAGKELWTYNAKGFIPQFQVADGLIALWRQAKFATYVLVALDAGTGRVVWEREGHIRSICFCNNRLFVALEGHIRAYDPTTGEELWDNQEAATSHWGTHLLYEDGLLYVEAETLRVLDANTGELLKKFKLQTAPGRTTISDGILYTADDDNEMLVAIDGQTGDVVWSKRIPLARYRHKPDLIDGILYVTTEEGHLLAINSNDGSLVWEYLDSPAVRVISNIIVLDKAVYAVFADDTLRGIDALTGREVGRLETEGIERPSIGDYFGIAKVAIAGDLLLITFDGATLFALQPQ